MLSADGKYYKTDVASTEIILRLIQSIPSKKAEPIKCHAEIFSASLAPACQRGRYARIFSQTS